MNPISSALPFDPTQSTAAVAQPKTTASDEQNQFLRLLVAQLKGQNPLDPMDGTQFVSQLAQFSSLEELTKIRTSMDSVQQSLAQPAPVSSPATSNQPTVQN